jgi:hypothetical protein
MTKPSNDVPLGDPRDVRPGDQPQPRTGDAQRIQNYRDALVQIPSDDPAAEMFRLIYPDLLRDGTYPDGSTAWDTSVQAVRKKYPDFEPDPGWRIA